MNQVNSKPNFVQGNKARLDVTANELWLVRAALLSKRAEASRILTEMGEGTETDAFLRLVAQFDTLLEKVNQAGNNL